MMPIETAMAANSGKLTVNFNYNCPQISSPVQYTVENGEDLSFVEDPVREGYIFTGWYTDPDCLLLYDLTVPVMKNLNLYAGWFEKVSYCDNDGSIKYCEDYVTIDSNHRKFSADKDMWLVFDGEKVELPQITLTGSHTYHLIIKDGQNITVDGGILIYHGTLEIYGQKAMTGTLTALGGYRAAGIGGTSTEAIVINGGNIFASGEEGAGIGTANGKATIAECKSITINGGNVHATSVSGAGIGTGSAERFYTACGDININGGTVNAQSTDGAGIGTGLSTSSESSCGNIHITGGTITAKASDRGAGIGTGFAGSNDNSCGDITIDKGEIRTESVEGAGIGLGYSYREARAGNITINGGNVISKSEEGQAIGKASFDSDWVIGERTVSKGMLLKSGDSEDTAVSVVTLSEATGKYARIWKAPSVGNVKVKPKGTSITKIVKGDKNFTVKWKKQSSKVNGARITGYQVQYATNKKFTKGKKTITVKGYSKTSVKIKKAKKIKKYYVKVRTYQVINGERTYSAWSKVKTV